MIELLKLLLSLSFSGTVLILILLLSRPLYRNRLSRQWQYYIWLIVVARMLLPFTPEPSLTGSLFQASGSAVMQLCPDGPELLNGRAPKNLQTKTAKAAHIERNVLISRFPLIAMPL